MNLRNALFCSSLFLITLLQAQTPCSNYPMIGFAALNGNGITTTTGGLGGKTTVVTTIEELQAWASTREKNTTPEILHISGKLTTTDVTLSEVTIKNGANISIYGINGGELQGIGLNIRDYNNVIVRNLKIHEVVYPNDGLTLDNVNHAWVDHNELYSINGPGITVDTYDGLLDVKKGSQYITISWNVLHDHKKVSLVGHTDNQTTAASEGDSLIRVSYHHNYFYNNDGRNPSLRFGAVHLFNNYFKIIYDYGIAVRQGAHALIENNVYEDVVTPIATNKFDGPEGFACERGNVFTHTGPSSITQTACTWWTPTRLPYSYTLDKASDVPALVIRDAGFCSNNAHPTQTLPLNILVTGLEDQPSFSGTFLIYPNPSLDQHHLTFSLSEPSEVTIELYNELGCKVNTLLQGTSVAGKQTYDVDTRALPSGVYRYKVAYDNKIASYPFLIQH